MRIVGRENLVMRQDIMTNMMRYIAISVMGIAGVIAALYPAYASVRIASYQAIYEFDLKGASAAAGISAITGKSHYVVKKECGGWFTSENYAISFGYQEGQSASLISYYQTWESDDGDSFTYEIIENSSVSGESAYEGFVQRTNTGIEAFSVDSDGIMKTLPDDTVFPSQQLRAILEMAENGTPVMSQSHVFFGGDQTDSLYFISAIVGRIRNQAPKNGLATTMGELGEDSYWPVSIAYYNPDSQEAEPAYTSTFNVQPNGIIRGYIVDYGTFKMQARLAKLQPIDVESCAH